MRGMLLVKPHATLIWEGKKKLIIKKRKYPFALGKWFFLVQGNRVYGVIRPYKITKITMDEFKKLRPLHRITDKEVKQWWGTPKTLYAYKFAFKKFKEPRTIRGKLPKGAQVWIKDVQLLEQFIADIKTYNPALIPKTKAGNARLRDDWRIVNAWYSTIRRGEKKFPHTMEQVLNLGVLIYKEIIKRVKAGIMKHTFEPEKMKPYSREFYNKIVRAVEKGKMFEYAPIHPSDPGTYERIYLKDILPYFKSFKTTKPVAYIVGGIVNNGSTTGRIDILIREKGPNLPLEFRIYRQFPQKYWHRFHFLYDEEHFGPFTNFIPIYDKVYEVYPNLSVDSIETMSSAPEEFIQKPFGSPGGKSLQVKKLIPLFPPHKVYVEPFCGGASVFFAKELAELNVLNDIDKDVATALRDIRSLTDEEFKQLNTKYKEGSRAQWEKLKRSEVPKNKVDRLYRFLYLTRFSYEKGRKTFSPQTAKDASISFDHLPAVREKLKDVVILNVDYKTAMRRYDSEDTFFYLDPPYFAEKHRGFKEKAWDVDPEELAEFLQTIKGKFLMSCNYSPETLKIFSKFKLRKFLVPRISPHIKGGESGGIRSKVYELLVSNYELKDSSFETKEREQRIAEAELSKKQDKVVPFRHFYLAKPLHGRYKEEVYSPDTVIKVMKQRKVDWFKTGIICETKFDGVAAWIHRVGDRVLILTEDGIDITKSLPALVEQAKTWKHDFVVGAELEAWINNKHKPRAYTTGILFAKPVHPEAKFIRANFYDVLWIDGKDIHNLPFYERLKFLDKLPNTELLRRSERRLVHSEQELREAIKYFSAKEGSEGTMFKLYNFKYPLTGRTYENMKYKEELSLDVKVLKRALVKGQTDVYYYYVALRDNILAGKTFNTSIRANPGDILKIVFIDISKYTDPVTKRVWFGLWNPRVAMLRKDKKVPDTAETATRMVLQTTQRIAEKRLPKDIRDALGVE